MAYQLNHTKYLSDAEASELESTLWTYSIQDRWTRDCLLLLVLLYTGARASEALAVRWDWLDLQRGTILIKGVKGSNDREIPLPGLLCASLGDFADRPRTADPRIFPISYSRLKAIWEQFRPNRKKLHSLRHTFAIRQLKKHGRIDVIKRLLGHKNVTNTMIYADYAFTDAEFRALVAPGGAFQSAGTLERSVRSITRLNSSSVPPKDAGKC